MGTEAAPVLFGIPFAICLVVLFVFTVSERKRSECEERVLGLGRGRLARGYLGALGALLLMCMLASFMESQPAIAVLYFMVFGLLLVIVLTVLLLPMLALLRRAGFASLLGVLCVGLMLAVAVGVVAGGDVVPSALVGGALAVAFSVAARLPFTRSNDRSRRSVTL